MNSIYIEITDLCNLRCSFCPSSKKKNPRTFMREDLFRRSILEAEKYVPQIYFHVLGEPTLHPEFSTFLNILETTSLKLNLTTNGTTIKKNSEIILNSKAIRQINFSTHAYAELPEEVQKKYLNDVLDFTTNVSEKCPDLYINLRLWNAGDLKSEKFNQNFLKKINRTFKTNISLPEFSSHHKSFNIQNRIYLHQDSRFEWPENKQEQKEIVKGSCRALNTHVAILHDGRVVACCLDYNGNITLGNINENSLEEILNTELALNIKEGFEANELRHPFCKTCSFCKRFRTPPKKI